MDINPLKERWRASKAVLNGWLAIPSGFSAEVMARQGWDSLTVDMQHGVQDYASGIECLRAITTTSTVPMVRVPWNDPGTIMKMLDGGAFGVICPMVSNREQAEQFVGACRYPDLGYRSIGPIRASLYGGPDYIANSEELIVTLAMIETREAMGRLDEIMATPGLDGVYVGPNDLSKGLGRPPSLDTTDPEAVAAIDKVLATAKSHGLVAGIHCAEPAYASQMVEKGFDMVTVSSDARLIMAGASNAIAQSRTGRLAE
jgi:4-hydroxy-2-oxoheptanedioate aldolase